MRLYWAGLSWRDNFIASLAQLKKEVLVNENWWVQAGQVVVRLDTRDAEVRLAQAQAALACARETVDQLFAAVAVVNERNRL